MWWQVWYGLTNATEIWQPVDAGYGQLLKAKTNENCELWYGEAMFTAGSVFY